MNTLYYGDNLEILRKYIGGGSLPIGKELPQIPLRNYYPPG